MKAALLAFTIGRQQENCAVFLVAACHADERRR
jgi:hypothetical protein